MTTPSASQDLPRPVPSDWNVPRPEELTAPTWWPAALSLGITLTAWGLIVSAIVLAMGLMVVLVSLAGWIGDLSHEHRED